MHIIKEIIKKNRIFSALTGINLLLLLFNIKDLFKSSDHLISYILFLVISVGIFLSFYKTVKEQRLNSEKYRKRKLFIGKIKKNKNSVLGFFIIIFMVYMAILAPFLINHDPIAIDWGAMLQNPSSNYLFGTDEFGRDTFSRIIYGSRVALGIGVIAVFINSLIGTILGLISGYFGGKIDNLIMRVVEIWSSIPFILLAIIMVSTWGSSILNLIVIVSITNVMGFVRIIRSNAMTIKNLDYIHAAKVMAIPDWYIIIKHILPNSVGSIIVLSTLRIGDTILTIAGLSFLGMGVKAPTPSWGAMLSAGQTYLSTNLYLSIVPGIFILLTVFGFNLLGDGLRDAFDSKLK